MCMRLETIMYALWGNSSVHVKSVEFIDNLLNCDSSDLSCHLLPMSKRQARRDLCEQKCLFKHLQVRALPSEIFTLYCSAIELRMEHNSKIDYDHIIRESE